VKGSTTVRGPNGHRSNGSEIEGRQDPRLKAGVLDGVPSGVGRRGGQTGCLDGVLDGARRGAQRGRTGCPTGGQTGWPDGVPNGWPDGVPNGWPDGVLDGARRVPRHFLNATSSATSFLNAMSPV
jgi:hypothetical protein